jgi:hypothetical protein
MRFCEAPLCSWVVAPANTWSNLAYIAVGVVILVMARDRRRTVSWWLGLSALAVGVTSFMYHASGTFLFQVADRAAMVTLSSGLVALTLRRWGWGRAPLLLLLAVLNAGTLGLDVALHRVFPAVGLLSFGGQVVAALLLEPGARTRDRARGVVPNARWLGWALACFLVAWAAWWLDLTGSWCEPSNHVVQGHALWHVLNAPCFLLLYLHHARAEPRLPLDRGGLPQHHGELPA